MMIDIRKLAAIDLHFLGRRLILTEFAAGVAGPIVLGALTLRMAFHRSWPVGLTFLGAYLLSLGVNYVPLLLHAVSLVRVGSVAEEIALELSDRGPAFRKYRRQSLYLLVPLFVAVTAFLQRGKSRSEQ